MRVLRVEDEERLAETVRRGLSDAGFVVEVVHNGEDGLWAATEHSYDVIVLDIMLPPVNGYKVLEQLRQRGMWPPVLMLTVKDGEYDQTDAFDLGADDYLTKPFSFLVPVARLRALIRRGGPERPVVMVAGDLTLDPARRRVERAKQEVTLTPRGHGLLEFLRRHRGETVSKVEILESVWDPLLHSSQRQSDSGEDSHADNQIGQITHDRHRNPRQHLLMAPIHTTRPRITASLTHLSRQDALLEGDELPTPVIVRADGHAVRGRSPWREPGEPD